MAADMGDSYMKRRGYFSFAIGRLLIGLLLGIVIFGLVTSYLKEIYNDSIYSGFTKQGETFEKMVVKYDEGTVGSTFVSIFNKIYNTDYMRVAKINDDGDFDVIFETDYDVIPIEKNIRDWIYITDDEALLEKGKSTEVIDGSEWSIRYRKSAEAGEFSDIPDQHISASTNLTTLSEFYGTGNYLYMYASEFSGNTLYSFVRIDSYAEDGDTFYPGKVSMKNGRNVIPGLMKHWDFTDRTNYGVYYVDTSGFDGLYYFDRPEYPEKFLAQEGDIFQAGNMRDLVYPAYDSRFVELNTEDSYRTEIRSGDLRTQGCIRIIRNGGNRYLLEYIITTVSFETYFRPFIILMAVILAVLGIGIPCLTAIRPYSQYKKAYENNLFKNNLIDSLAHNLKTPLQIIGGYAENLKDATDEADKSRYSDSIMAKITEMNMDIEEILKTAGKSSLKFSKTSLREIFEEAAEKIGTVIKIKGDRKTKIDRDYFRTAVFNLLDNAARYRTKDSEIEVNITPKAVVITNKTGADSFTPGYGIAIAGRIIGQHGQKLSTELNDGVFEARITGK